MIATSPESAGTLSASPAPSANGGLRLVKPGDEIANSSLERARELFRQAWTLMEKRERNAEESERMVNSAHASRYYWEEAGSPVNRAVAEWLLSRCYAGLGRAEPALYHAKRCEELSAKVEGNNVLCRAYAQEALARAYLLDGGGSGGSSGSAAKALEAADSLSEKMPGPDGFYLKQELGALRRQVGV